MSARILTIVCFLLLSVPQVSAQNADRGRMADGRAYRIGNDGYRLVDQIAELQVTNDELRRQVAALETDLDAKEVMLKRCGTGAVTSKTSASSTEPPNCNELVSSLYLRVSRLQQQLEQEGGSLPPATNVACDYNSQANPLWRQVEQLKTQVEERDTLLSKLQDEQQDALRVVKAKQAESIKQLQVDMQCDYQSTANPLWSRVQNLEEQLKVQTALAEKRGTQVAKLKEQSDALAAAATSANARARLASKPKPVRVVKRVLPSSTDVDVAKREFTATLSEIQSLIFKRKSLYDRLKKAGGGVSISVQPLETRNRVSLDSLRRQVSRLSSGASASKIRKGLKEIKQILRNDISVLNRLAKRKR